MPIDASASLSPLPTGLRRQRAGKWLWVTFTLALALIMGAFYFALRDQTATAGVVAQNGGCQPFTIDFGGLPAGTIISNDQYASQGVHITVTARNGFPDRLIVFDTNSTDSDLDTDLRTPEIGNIAILANNLTDGNGDGLVDKPDENNFGGIVTFAFDSPVRIGQFIFVDHDHQPTDFVAAFDATNNLIKKVTIPMGGNGSVQTIDVNADGVSRFVLDFRDSGGFKGPEIECPPGPTATPTSPAATSTPPVETPTPPAETPTPPVATPTTPPGGTPTPPVPTPTEALPTPTIPVETPSPTPQGQTPTPTPTPTQPGETPTPTPTPTQPGETPTPTPSPTQPGEIPTPVGETPTPTPPLGGETATPSPSPIPTSVAAVPTPTGAAQAAVLGAVTGPGGAPAGVPGAGGPTEMGDRTAGLLLSFGVLLVLAGAVVALAESQKRA